MANIVDLLENFWIIKERDRELYYEYKNMDKAAKDFIREKLGYNLVINQHLVKLEKVPESPSEWMGIDAFSEPMDYVLLCLLLSFLEDKNREEQFLLSHITEYMQINYPEGDLDWTCYTNRKSLIRVLNFANEIGIIKIDDGNQDMFSENYQTEVLYESTGISRYFIRNLTKDITNLDNCNDILNAEWLSGDEDKGIIRRMRVYRSLFTEPVVYGNNDAFFTYIKNFRNNIQNDIEQYIGGELHIYKNCAYVVVDDNRFKNSFPEDKNICDIALLFIKELLMDFSDIKNDDTMEIKDSQFDKILAECIEKYKNFWTKEYREKSFEKLKAELTAYMIENYLIEYDGKFRIMPLALRFTGDYPEDLALEE